MNYLKNDFLIPVILGDSEDAYDAASVVYKITKIRPHIFSHRFSLLHKLLYECHKIPCKNDLAIVGDICNFASKMEREGSLLLIYSEDKSELIEKYSQEIESRYIAIPADQILMLRIIKQNN